MGPVPESRVSADSFVHESRVRVVFRHSELAGEIPGTVMSLSLSLCYLSMVAIGCRIQNVLNDEPKLA